jgi:prepilin-type processing-associated H-X9-DG protein
MIVSSVDEPNTMRLPLIGSVPSGSTARQTSDHDLTPAIVSFLDGHAAMDDDPDLS